jgi:hypothetical protein
MIILSYMAAVLILKRKFTVFSLKLQKTILISMDLYWIENDPENYPFGYKYSWIAVDIEDKNHTVLFDCHPPKGPHIHIGPSESSYDWVSIEKTESDFWELVDKEFGPLEEEVK